ncbi:MAG: hypothetical protein DMD72_11320, partial [Gemmatimonadetes bacterium]
MLEKSYNIALVVFSISVAAIGAYATIEIARRVRATEGRRRQRWIYGGIVAMALGAWSMDFVGLFALRLTVPVWYDILLVIASFLAAVMGSAIAFFVINRDSARFSLLTVGS